MKITGKTRIMFILADPVDHVMGTHVLNQRFATEGYDIAVSALQVAPDDLACVINGLRRCRNLIGFGVTIPHKINVMALLDRCTTRATFVGAVNFVRRDEVGTLTGDNLDGAGFVDGLAVSQIALRGQRVLQIGAGGAGRAVAFAIAEAGAAQLCIHNRTQTKAIELAAAVAAASSGCVTYAGGADPRGFDVVVNTTSAGMHEGDPLPVDTAGLSADTAVVEVIMQPEMTPLLTAAQARGCRIGLGRYMLEEQFKLVKQFLSL